MPTRQEYSKRLLPLLTEGFTPQLLTTSSATFSIEELADIIGGILEKLEQQHLGAASNIQALLAERSTEPWEGHGELAFLLYYLHNPPSELRVDIDALPELKLIWDAMAAVAAVSPFTPSTFNLLLASLPSKAMVKCTKWGNIYGAGKYEQLDAGWAWTLKNNLMNHIPKRLGTGYGIADFVTKDWSQPVALQPGSDGQVRIAIIGDWGAGKYNLNGLKHKDGPACAVMDTLCELDTPPDYLIHLGDTYYSGTGPNRSPTGEEKNHLIDILSLYPKIAKPGHCFTLNSNHEMYGGAYGYYGAALSNPLFSGQKGCSYFALEFGNWIIAGIDSAYFDSSTLYMDGGLGNNAQNPQYQFLQQVEACDKKVIVMSHHTGLSTDGGSPSKHLWSDVTSVVTPVYWYWGHTHIGAVYSSKAYSNSIKTRCIGHSSMPFAIPPGMEECRQNVEWYSDSALDSSMASQTLYYSQPRAKNGFAILTLSKDSITEQVYEIGNNEPIWSS